MSRILITGGLGGIGQYIITNLLEEGSHNITIFDLKNRNNEIIVKKKKFTEKNVKIVWGDITDPSTYPDLSELDIIIHMAFIIPPMSEILPEKVTRKVNVEGTKSLIKKAEMTNFIGKFIFASSVTVFGPTMWYEPPVKVDHSINPTDRYTFQKAECENMLKNSNLKWLILRVSGAMNLKQDLSPENLKIMYSIPYDQRFEFVHPMDVALAFSNAVNIDAENEIFIISGGKRCQIRYHELIDKLMGVFNLPPTKRSKFSTRMYYVDYYDTERSQALLNYQTRTVEDFIQDFQSNIGSTGEFIKLMAPIAKYFV